MTEDDLLHQDEILAMMYWMRGEKIDEFVTREQLNRFLQLDARQLEGALEWLASRGLIEAVENAFRLTPRGVEEGKRRFVDEFTPYLGKESHLECNDPDCDCHDTDFVGVCKHLEH